MSAAGFLFRAELRSGGWRFVVGSSVLIGVVGGGALLSAAGARRTATAFERLEHDTRAATVLVNPDDGVDGDAAFLTPEIVRQLPGVIAASRANGVLAFTGERVDQNTAIMAGQGDDWFTSVDRPVVREGRLPDQTKAFELFANPAGAESLGLEVGDTVELSWVSFDEVSDRGDIEEEAIVGMVRRGEIGDQHEATLVGIGETTGDVVPGAVLPTLSLTSGFTQATGASPLYFGVAVRLSRGAAGVDDFVGELQALIARRAGTSGNGATPSIDYQTLAADRETIRRSLSPQVIALATLAGALAIAAALAAGQALGRQVAIRSDDDATLAALGLGDSERRRVDQFRLAAVVVAGTSLAIIGAAVASPATPTSIARAVEPNPGFDFDAVVLLGGGVALATLIAGVGAVLGTRSRHREVAGVQSSSLAAWVRNRTDRPALATGIGYAFEQGTGPTSIPTRSTLVGAVIGLTALTSSITFAASLNHFVATPRAHGSTFDARVSPDQIGEGEEFEVAAYRQLIGYVGASDDVTSWSTFYSGQVRLPRGLVPANIVGLEYGARVAPTLVRGRLPRGDDEVALGARTLHRESVDLGDRLDVRYGSTTRRVDVVGQVVLPGIAGYLASDQAALGEGALFGTAGMERLVGRPALTAEVQEGAVSPNAILVTFDDATSVSSMQSSLDERFGAGRFLVEPPVRSADVQSLVRVRAMPVLLASLLGAIAAFAVAHALFVAVARRRLDLALLRALGFTPGQVRWSIAWQATAIALVASLIGLPLGVVTGRLAWSAVARQLGVVERPIVPMLLLGAIPAAVAFANLVALVPGRRAARLKPAEILRSE